MRSSRWMRRLGVSVMAVTASALLGAACGPRPPSLSDVSVAEQGGTAVLTFNLGAPAPGLTLRYETGDITATAPADYTATSGTLTFAAGETSKTISVPVADDALDEDDEVFGLLVADGQTPVAAAFATVEDDDATPSVALASKPTFVEGNAGTSNGGKGFRLELSAPSGRPVTVDFRTSDGFGTLARATAPADYTATSKAVTFAPGTTSVSVGVPIVGDTLDEAAREAFTATLSNPFNAVLGNTTRGPGVIADDDDPPSVVIGDASAPEWVGALSFPVRLSAPSGLPISVAFTTTDGTAVEGEDYDATSGTLTWTAGTTTQRTVSVPVIEDSCREGNEALFLDLGTPQNVALPDPSGLGTIRDDDLFSC